MTQTPDSKTLYYVFDPLCGWCYAAMPALATLQDVPGVRLQLLPAGLFSGAGARRMDDAFAAYAWSNDQRIERLTGQPFTEAYREQVLGNRTQAFDSGPATLALTAVALTAPALQREALEAIQRARYLDGRDVTSMTTLADLLRELGLDVAAARLASPTDDLRLAAQERAQRAQVLLHEFHARGVPALIVESGNHRALVDHSATYGQPAALIDLLEAA